MKNKILFTKKIPIKKLDTLSNSFFIDCKNFIRIEYLNPNSIPICNDFILTSSNTIESLIKLFSIDYLKNKNYYLIGEKSEKKLRKITKNISIVAENSELLAEQLIKSNKKKFVYFGSNRRISTIEEKLYKSGKNIQRIDSYKTVLNPCKINQVYDAIVFMSPSAVESFFILNKQIPKKTCIFAIGNTTKLAFSIHSNFLNNLVIVPKKTNLNELLDCVKKQFNDKK